MMDSGMKESTTMSIPLPDKQYDVVKCMADFLKSLVFDAKTMEIPGMLHTSDLLKMALEMT